MGCGASATQIHENAAKAVGVTDEEINKAKEDNAGDPKNVEAALYKLVVGKGYVNIPKEAGEFDVQTDDQGTVLEDKGDAKKGMQVEFMNGQPLGQPLSKELLKNAGVVTLKDPTKASAAAEAPAAEAKAPASEAPAAEAEAPASEAPAAEAKAPAPEAAVAEAEAPAPEAAVAEAEAPAAQ